MRILATSNFLIAAALAIHLCWWRVRRPARAVRSLCALFAGVAAAWLFAVLAMPAVGLPASVLGPRSVWDVAYVVLFYVAMCLVYLITYIGIEAESPSVLILCAARRAGPEGLARADLGGAISDAEMIDSRLLNMQQAGVVRCVDGRYSLTGYGRAYLAFYLLPRFLMGMTRKGG